MIFNLKSRSRGEKKNITKTRQQHKQDAQEKIKEGLKEVSLNKISEDPKPKGEDILNGPIKSLSVIVSGDELKKNKAAIRDKFKKLLAKRKQ